MLQFGSSESQSKWQASDARAYPEFAMLADRCTNVVNALGISFPDPRKGCVRLDQGKPGISAYIPAICPKSVLWLPHFARQVDGWEKLAYQFMFLSEEQLRELRHMFSFSFAADVAGNAFAATDCLYAVLVAVFGIALGAELQARLTRPTKLSRGDSELFEYFDPSDSDLD